MTPEGGRGQKSDLLPAEVGVEPIEELLSEKLGEIVPEPKRQEVTRVVHEVIASFSGPLPPPSTLYGYDEIVPGAGDRIIRMAEKEQEHRHSWEQSELSAEHWYSMFGLLAGWTTALALAGGAVVAAIYGQAVVGAALAAASATGMVWKLVQGRSDNVSTQPVPSKQEQPRGREGKSRGKRR